MGDILRIYSGGAQVNLYDSTNGVLHLGYTSEEIAIESTPQQVPISSGNRVQIEQMVSFEATILETDSTKIDALMVRKGYLQEVYIVGLDSAFKFRDVFIRIKQIRSMKAGDAHMVTISGARYAQSIAAAATLPETNYCQFIQNILGAFGNMDVDAGGGVPTGWTNSGASSLSVAASHLGGGYTNEWRFTLSDAGDFVYCRVRFPLDKLPFKFTMSAYIDNIKAGTSYFKLAYVLRDCALSSFSSALSDEMSLDSGENDRFSQEWTITPSAVVCYVDFCIYGTASDTAELGVDNVQVEIGELTDYVENA